MSHNEAAPGAGSAPQVRPAGRLSLSNRRLPFKLIAILLVPVLAALAFAGLRVQSSYTAWQQAQDAQKVAKLVEASTQVTQAIDQERDGSIPYLMKPGSAAASAPLDQTVKKLRDNTNTAIANFEALAANAPNIGHVQERIAAAKPQLAKIDGLRKLDYSQPTTTAEEAYSSLFSALQGLDNELVFSNGGSINSDGRAIYAITLAKDADSIERAIVLHMLLEKYKPNTSAAATTLYFTQQMKAFSYLYLQGIAQQEFTNAADPAFVTALNQGLQNVQAAMENANQQSAAAAQGGGAKSGKALDIQGMVNILVAAPDPAHARAAGVTPLLWGQETTAVFDALRTVESKLVADAVTQASDQASKARNDAIMNAAIVLGAVLLAGVMTALVARSMIRNMRRLRDGAEQVAQQRLPDLVRQLSKTDPGKVDLTVEPIQVNGKDEIAEVARAFDEVHREAIRLASEQALLRGNVNAIFTNLSRRSHGLIERQLALITDLENNEADPDQLENLFKLDHLATRMRRNGENLLVLAGEDPGRTWGEPIPLVDVLRAAASEVEQYERIELAGIPETDVVGPAVTDLVHLLAELLENATTFSSPQTKVRVTATRLPDQRVLVEIHDKGIGLTSEDFAEINAKLADPPTVDASVSRQMGLFVVGRLSERHGIRVQLRPSGESAGTTSLVMLPERLTLAAGAVEPEEQFTVSRIYPEAAQGAGMAGMRTASELGFDDSRYDRALEAGEQGSALDSVQRSLRLGQRRQQVALESGDSPAYDERTPAPAEYGYSPEYGGQEYADGAQAFDGFDAEYRSEFETEPRADYSAQYGSGYAQGFGAENASGHPQNLDGSHARGHQPSPSYPAPDAGYEAGRYTAQHFEAGVAEHETYGADYAEDTYLTPGATPGMQHYGTGAPAYEPGPVAPQSPQGQEPTALGANGLPTRRPGAALGGGAIGGRDSGERPNWFTGAKESGQTTSAMPVMPPAHGRPAAALPAAGPSASAPREASGAGTTTSGLPRRVPKQNLLPGQFQDPDGAGTPDLPSSQPQLSRSPEEVRGRLTNLRRGIQQGHNAGDTPHQGSGPYGTNPQER
ncbi:sensor histidine kinase [Streptacidiphilus jiangxiensis]|uniref:sensor histidine kinase n=1 Tax=Streptacidiphilus jiangxiensis TaxID=235985 RepID=UPI00069396C1|nr:nitrate- and nitrite sensing domain-containing protein [Streptacidiphilus jiangxiensis]